MPDKKDFINIFKAEAEDHLTKLDKGVVELEKRPDNLELVKELNRVTHTLKGASRIFGFHEIQEITHKIEDVLDRVGQRQIVFSPAIADRILRGLDAIRGILEQIVKEEKVNVDVPAVCAQLEECLPGKAVTLEQPDAEKAKAEKKTEEVKKEELTSPPRNEKKRLVIEDKQEKKIQPIAQRQVEEYIRVPLSRVNRLLNLVGEIVINKMKASARVAQTKNIVKLSKEVQKRIADLGEGIKKQFPLENSDTARALSQCNAQIQKLRENARHLYDGLSTEAFHLEPVINELQTKMKEIRMLPCSTIFEGFPRMIRDIAAEKKKEIRLEISGGETELDRKVLEGIKASLIHILHNSVDHGIENPDRRVSLGKPRIGTIKLSAYHEAGSVIMTIEDDGRGIDIEEVKQTAAAKGLVSGEELAQMSEKEIFNLIFMNGYSTSPIITDVSGRGIGLDVVRRDINNLKGRFTLDAQKDKGTTLTLILPLTIAIIQVLLFKTQKMLFAFPMTSILESRKVKMKEVATLEGRMAIQIGGHTVPIVELNEVLGLPQTQMSVDEQDTDREEAPVVIAASLEKRVGFIVEEIVGEEEVFIKGLGEQLGKVKNVGGAAILGTGEVVVILDTADLIADSALSYPAVPLRKPKPKEKKKGKRILVVEDTLYTRELEKSIFERQGYLVDTAVDGLDGLDKMTRAKYDLILTDIHMPGMDGFAFCETIKKKDEYKKIPVVIITTVEREEDKRRGIAAGAQAYIVKTAFDQSHLLDTVERLTR